MLILSGTVCPNLMYAKYTILRPWCVFLIIHLNIVFL